MKTQYIVLTGIITLISVAVLVSLIYYISFKPKVEIYQTTTTITTTYSITTSTVTRLPAINYLTNGNFETGSLNPWFTIGTSNASYHIKVVSNVVHSGSYSLLVEGTPQISPTSDITNGARQQISTVNLPKLFDGYVYIERFPEWNTSHPYITMTLYDSNGFGPEIVFHNIDKNVNGSICLTWKNSNFKCVFDVIQPLMWHHFDLTMNQSYTGLYLDSQFIGSWNSTETFSMSNLASLNLDASSQGRAYFDDLSITDV
jgi:hypothetical protein